MYDTLAAICVCVCVWGAHYSHGGWRGMETPHSKRKKQRRGHMRERKARGGSSDLASGGSSLAVPAFFDERMMTRRPAEASAAVRHARPMMPTLGSAPQTPLFFFLK